MLIFVIAPGFPMILCRRDSNSPRQLSSDPFSPRHHPTADDDKLSSIGRPTQQPLAPMQTVEHRALDGRERHRRRIEASPSFGPGVAPHGLRSEQSARSIEEIEIGVGAFVHSRLTPERGSSLARTNLVQIRCRPRAVPGNHQRIRARRVSPPRSSDEKADHEVHMNAR